MHLPRVLIFGQPFNKRHGGGITLSNLFMDWDKDKLAVAATGHVMNHVTSDVCRIYYQLGNVEHRWKFPFNLFQRKFESGLLTFEDNKEHSIRKSKSGIRYFLVNKLFYPTLEWFGLYHNAAQLRLSDGFKEWLLEYKPELLYLQVSSLDTIAFARQLKEFLGIPSVIHMMDDWPSTISKGGLFANFWHKRIDKEFRTLLDQTDLFLSISGAMTDEYMERYNRIFIPFHNPIDTSIWKNHNKKNHKPDRDNIKILYSGRIGPGITNSLVEVAKAVENINQRGLGLKFHILSPGADPDIVNRLRRHESIVIDPVADYSELPRLYSNADILVIANDFDEKGISFLRFSMPTKASEYMISGTPVLVYSHYETAVSKFFLHHNCGCCVTSQNPEHLSDALIKLIINEEYRNTLSYNAVRIASELFDAEKKRKEFQQLLINATKEHA